MKRHRNVSYARVRELFDYQPKTGKLIWLVAHGRWKRIPAGTAAGTLTTANHLVVRIDGDNYLCHRVIWLWVTGKWPANEIDHRDLNGSNNKWSNLRTATHAQNNQNKKVQKNSRTKFKGVQKIISGRWRAYISIGRKFRHIGMFDTPQEARRAYLKAAKRLYGDFARG
jgi:hypothetical protein